MRRPAIASLLLGIVLALSLIVVACSAQTAPAPSAPANAPGASAPTSAPAQSGQAAAKAEKVLTIGVAGDIETIDPPFGAATRANETIKNIYDQPLRYARKSTGEGYEIADVTKVEGSAWESFTIDPDGVTVRVKVRPGTKFTKSGNEVTADDVAYKFERSFGVKAGTQWIANTVGIFDMNQIKVDGKNDVTIKLKDPTPLFGPLMRDQDFGMEDSKAVKSKASADDPWATKWMAKNDAGSGEYFMESWTPGVEMVLRANKDYWAGPAYFDKVVIKIVPSAADRVLLLRQGAIDIAEDLTLDEIEGLRGSPGVKILSIPSRNQILFGLNNSLPPFNNVKVRQALSYAVPYDQIVKDVFKGQALAGKGAWPQRAQFHDSSTFPYTYDPEKAKALLAEAGAQNLKFQLAIRQGQMDMEQLAVVLQNAFRQVGVDMEIQKVAPAVFQEKLAKREHVAWMQPSLSYVDDPFYHLFLWYKTDTVINWFKYSNKRVDEITEALRTELDPKKRETLAKEAQKIINSEAPALYPGELNYVLAMRDNIDGFVLEPDHLVWYYPLRRKE